MGKASAEIKEVRFRIKPELTEAYIFYQGHGDCPEPGTTGWHHKTFPISMSIIDILKAEAEGKDNSLLWPLAAPDEG